MPDYRSMYDRDYIGHFDLPGGKDLTLTIKKVMGGELTAIGGRKSKKPIVHFKQAVKPLICNKTNAKTIAAMYGNMVEEWAGKAITLFVSTTRDPSGGGEVECIRIRPKVPKTAGTSFDDDDAAPDAAPQDSPLPATSSPAGSPAAAAPYSEQIKAAATLQDLVAVWNSIPNDDRELYIAAKDARKAELA